MLFTNLMRQLSGEVKLEEVAEQTAARARHAVWDRVRRQVDTMGPAEARGYVRARAAMVVHREVDRSFRHDPTLRRAARAHLIDLTTQTLVRMVADQVSFSQAVPLAYETPFVLRRAA